MKPDFDVLLAGGSYGAQIAARDLVGHGLRVGLFDRRGRAGYPPASTSGLARIWTERFRLPVGGECTPITSFHVYGPNGEEALMKGAGLTGMADTLVEPDMLGRMECDSVSKGLVARHGVTVTEPERCGDGWSVRIRPGSERFTTRYLVDATGYQAWIGRHVGMVADLDPEDAHGGVEITVPMPESHPRGQVRMWLSRRDIPWGYAWAFPSSEGGVPTVRVGLGTPRAATHTAGRYFTAFLKAHPEYDGRIYHRAGGIIPTAPVNGVLVRDGVFLVGDAARLCDASTGGGILGALASGEAVAESIIAGRPNSYPSRLKWLISELRVRWILKQLLYGMTDAELGTLVSFLSGLDVSDRRELNPMAERPRVTWGLLTKHPRVAATLLTRGRFWHALFPQTMPPIVNDIPLIF